MKSNQQIKLPFGLHKKLSSPNDVLLTLVCRLTNNVGLLAPESQFTHIWGSFCRWHPVWFRYASKPKTSPQTSSIVCPFGVGECVCVGMFLWYSDLDKWSASVPRDNNDHRQTVQDQKSTLIMTTCVRKDTHAHTRARQKVQLGLCQVWVGRKWRCNSFIQLILLWAILFLINWIFKDFFSVIQSTKF